VGRVWEPKFASPLSVVYYIMGSIDRYIHTGVGTTVLMHHAGVSVLAVGGAKRALLPAKNVGRHHPWGFLNQCLPHALPLHQDLGVAFSSAGWPSPCMHDIGHACLFPLSPAFVVMPRMSPLTAPGYTTTPDRVRTAEGNDCWQGRGQRAIDINS